MEPNILYMGALMTHMTKTDLESFNIINVQISHDICTPVAHQRQDRTILTNNELVFDNLFTLKQEILCNITSSYKMKNTKLF